MSEQLWAPWRLKYIESGIKPDGCIFCMFPALPVEKDSGNLILYRGELAFILLNAYPYSNGHLMVVPYRHTSTLDSLTVAELTETSRLVRVAVNVLAAAFRPDGFNLGVNMGHAAGAGIADHLHWHVVPRWSGDTNFMPVLAGVKVIPESLEVVRLRLVEALPPVLEVESSAT